MRPGCAERWWRTVADPTHLDAGEPPDDDDDTTALVPPPVDWRKATPPASRGRRWEEFAKWAEWYLRRFEIPESVVPPCWRRHPVLIEELSALWTAYETSYMTLASGASPLVWLHQADLSRGRMVASMGIYSCSRTSGHQPPGTARQDSLTDVGVTEAAELGLGREIGQQRGMAKWEES